MPVYNGEKFITQTIDSVLNQTFSDFEFIIVDDGSTDNSERIVKSYNDERIKFFKNKNNSGIVFSLNRALEISCAEYIARIDADDICMKERLKIQSDFLDSNENVGVCSANICYIDAEGVEGRIVKMPISADECKVNFLFGNQVIHPAAMFRRELAVKVGGYTVGMEPAEDYDFWIKLLEISEIQNIDEVLLKYRTHSSNYSIIKRHEYNQKFTEILGRRSKLRFPEMINSDFLNFHVKSMIGTWNEVSYFEEVVELKRWRKSLIENNSRLKIFNQLLLKKSIDRNLISILLSIIKCKGNAFRVKALAFKMLFSFSVTNIWNNVKNKI